MPLIHNAAARLIAVSALATLRLDTVAEAQINGQGGGGMMGGGWGWGMGYGMGGVGGIGVLFARACRCWYRCHGAPSPQFVSRIIPPCFQRC
jgi:hypothetical protein